MHDEVVRLKPSGTCVGVRGVVQLDADGAAADRAGAGGLAERDDLLGERLERGAGRRAGPAELLDLRAQLGDLALLHLRAVLLLADEVGGVGAALGAQVRPAGGRPRSSWPAARPARRRPARRHPTASAASWRRRVNMTTTLDDHTNLRSRRARIQGPQEGRLHAAHRRSRPGRSRARRGTRR